MISIPISFYCPITHDVMKNPVVDKEGNSYEESAIREWLTQNAVSPITRNPLYTYDLTPNRALKNIIDEFISTNESSIQITSQNNSKIELQINTNNKYKHVSIIPSNLNTRYSADICIIIDISGSMDEEAIVKNELGQNEKCGLTLLDIAKHAVKTVVNCLTSTDRMSIVVYSTSARTLMNMEYMTQTKKDECISMIDRIHTEGTTNIWDGLKHGLDQFTSKTNYRNSGIFLLTDGQPNVEPPRGHIPMLNKYFDEHQNFNAIINTFGFGYNLDSKLLNDIAKIGKGSYSFIPDSSFVGTVFEHSIANFLATATINNTLCIESDDVYSIMNIEGPYDVEYTSWGAKINIGHMQFGQTKDIIIEMNNSNTNIEPTLTYIDLNESIYNKVTKYTSLSNSEQFELHEKRFKFVSCIKSAIDYIEVRDMENANLVLNDFIKQLKSCKIKHNLYIKNLIKDMEGQVMEAFSRNDWYHRWGKHYIPSLIGAHLLQQCNNFKDYGVQHFGGELFNSIRDHADEIFCNLPPPQPQQIYTAPISSEQFGRQFSQNTNPCFLGECLVLMADEQLKKIKDIQKGDCIKTPTGNSKVLCVVKTQTGGSTDIVHLDGGLKITPWHPIKVNNRWVFPCELSNSTETKCKFVYSFVLETEHIMIINNIQCITLGHTIDEPVAKHSYFGSQSVINDLRKCNGWKNGLIQLKENPFKRDLLTGLINGLNK